MNGPCGLYCMTCDSECRHLNTCLCDDRTSYQDYTKNITTPELHTETLYSRDRGSVAGLGWESYRRVDVFVLMNMKNSDISYLYIKQNISLKIIFKNCFL